MRKLAFPLLLAAAVAIVALVSTLGSGGRKAAHPVAEAEELRTLAVSTGREPSPSRPGGELHALRTGGHVPAATVLATVLTDEDCAADRHGISHCRNALRLADGSKLTVRHPHDMHMVPCLSPGERVRVRPA